MIGEEAQSVHAAFAAVAARWPERAMLNVLAETAAVYGIAAGELSYGAAAGQVGPAR